MMAASQEDERLSVEVTLTAASNLQSVTGFCLAGPIDRSCQAASPPFILLHGWTR